MEGGQAEYGGAGIVRNTVIHDDRLDENVMYQ